MSTPGAGADGAPSEPKKVVRRVVKKKDAAVDDSKWEEKQRVPPSKIDGDIKEYMKIQYCRDMTARNVWYYRDRLSTPRGPCTLSTLREAWVTGTVDENTLVWGEGLGDFIPIRNVRTLVAQIRTPEVKLATWLNKKLLIEPRLRMARKARGEAAARSNQVDNMF
ncbi:unnamed protein product [Pedinophyceae sp. YPF-701]|nr:unnamed protein product [Pedinophyceae sp. YPF-701]